MLFLVLIYKFMMEVTVTKPWSECCLGSTKAKVFAIGLQSRENFQDVSGSWALFPKEGKNLLQKSFT